jgi:hypothetical protein
MKKIRYTLIGIALFYWIITLIAPPIVDNLYNPVVNPGPYTTSEDAQKLYASLDLLVICIAMRYSGNVFS